MTRLESCSSCGGFIPAAARACPNCGYVPSLLARRLWGLMCLAGGGAVAVTLAACYGPGGYYPCSSESPNPYCNMDLSVIDLSEQPDLQAISPDLSRDDGASGDGQAGDGGLGDGGPSDGGLRDGGRADGGGKG